MVEFFLVHCIRTVRSIFDSDPRNAAEHAILNSLAARSQHERMTTCTKGVTNTHTHENTKTRTNKHPNNPRGVICRTYSYAFVILFQTYVMRYLLYSAMYRASVHNVRVGCYPPSPRSCLFFFTPGRRWVEKPLPHSFEPRFESRRPDAAKRRLALGVYRHPITTGPH